MLPYVRWYDEFQVFLFLLLLFLFIILSSCVNSAILYKKPTKKPTQQKQKQQKRKTTNKKTWWPFNGKIYGEDKTVFDNPVCNLILSYKWVVASRNYIWQLLKFWLCFEKLYFLKKVMPSFLTDGWVYQKLFCYESGWAYSSVGLYSTAVLSHVQIYWTSCWTQKMAQPLSLWWRSQTRPELMLR